MKPNFALFELIFCCSHVCHTSARKCGRAFHFIAARFSSILRRAMIISFHFKAARFSSIHRWRSTRSLGSSILGTFPLLLKADIHAEYVSRIFHRIWISYVVKCSTTNSWLNILLHKIFICLPNILETYSACICLKNKFFPAQSDSYMAATVIWH